MTKIIISLWLLLPASASAQYMKEYQVEIDLAAQTDSVDIVTIPPGCAIEYCGIIVDTVVANANVFTVGTKESQTTALTYNFIPEQDIVGSIHVGHTDVPTGATGDTVVLYYTTLGGDNAIGRVRVYIRWVELF